MSGSVVQSAGITTIIWGGTTYNVDSKSVSFAAGGLVNKAVMNGNQISMAQDSVTPSMCQVNLALLKGATFVGLKAFNGQELQVELDSGQTWTIDAAYITDDPKFKGGAGNNVTIKWQGAPATEVIAS
jgi:hypothetical protein